MVWLRKMDMPNVKFFNEVKNFKMCNGETFATTKKAILPILLRGEIEYITAFVSEKPIINVAGLDFLTDIQAGINMEKGVISLKNGCDIPLFMSKSGLLMLYVRDVGHNIAESLSGIVPKSVSGSLYGASETISMQNVFNNYKLWIRMSEGLWKGDVEKHSEIAVCDVMENGDMDLRLNLPKTFIEIRCGGKITHLPLSSMIGTVYGTVNKNFLNDECYVYMQKKCLRKYCMKSFSRRNKQITAKKNMVSGHGGMRTNITYVLLMMILSLLSVIFFLLH